jgi:rare lipoprotein A
VIQRSARAGILLAAFGLLALAGCQRKPVRAESPQATASPAGDVASGTDDAPDGGPAIPPDVSRVPEPVPRAEPRARYGNHSPYTVLGRTYTVLPTCQGYFERGLASWYGTKFHGRYTSSREPYDMYLMTAAHKRLPLPCYVRVTNLENGRSLIVRVNDRGPFHEGRIIDLSYSAAIRLGVHAKGTARVEVRAIDVGTAEPALPSVVAAPAPGPTVAIAPGKPVYVQVGAYDRRENARRVAKRLEEARIDDVILDQVLTGRGLLHRVRVGPFDDTEALNRQIARIGAMGYRSIVVPAD